MVFVCILSIIHMKFSIQSKVLMLSVIAIIVIMLIQFILQDGWNRLALGLYMCLTTRSLFFLWHPHTEKTSCVLCQQHLNDFTWTEQRSQRLQAGYWQCMQDVVCQTYGLWDSPWIFDEWKAWGFLVCAATGERLHLKTLYCHICPLFSFLLPSALHILCKFQLDLTSVQ